MSEIPLPTNFQSILSGGSSSPMAPLSAFGNDGVRAVARGLQDVARGIVINKKSRDELERIEKEKEDRLWIAKAMSEYGRGLTDFEVDPNNANDPNYLPRYNENAERERDRILGSAPSPEAAELFEIEARSTVDQRYARQAARSADNEIKADIRVFEEAWGTVMGDYHRLAAQDPEAAYTDLTNALGSETEMILDMYGEIAPDLAKEMIALRIKDAAIALIDKYPEKAKQLVNENGAYIDETSRQAILAKIERKSADLSLLAADDFNLVREENLLAAQRNQDWRPIPLEDYQRLYPGEKGEVMKREDDRKLMAAAEAHTFLLSIGNLLPDQKAEKAREYAKTLKTEDQINAFAHIVEPILQEEARLYEYDGVAWLTQNNEELRVLQKDMQMAEEAYNDAVEYNSTPGAALLGLPNDASGQPREDPAIIKQTLDDAKRKYYNAVLRYQGAADPDTKKTDAFLNRPRMQRHLLTRNEAQVYADHINGGDIDAAIATINGLMERYPTDEQRAQVIADLATLPKNGIDSRVKIAFQNKDQPWLPQFLGAVRSMKDLGQVGDTQRLDIKERLQSDPTWITFYNSVAGPQNQRHEEVNGYYNAIETYAQSGVLRGLSPKEAVDKAIDQVLTSTMKPVEVTRPSVPHFSTDVPWGPEDQTLWLPRKIGDRVFSDEELDNLGFTVGQLLTKISPEDVDMKQFPWADLDKDTRRKLIRDHILSTGQVYLEPGGKALRLTVEDTSLGGQTDLRNKDGNFFRLPVEKIPHWKPLRFWGGTVKAQKEQEERVRSGIRYDQFTNQTLYWEFAP